MAPKPKKQKKDGSSSSGTYMGLKHLPTAAKAKWATLSGRNIRATKFADVNTLELLGLLQPVSQLLEKVGLRRFLAYSAPTYKRHTLEFLSTLCTVDTNAGPGIAFHLNDKEEEMTYAQLAEAFGWDIGTEEACEEYLGANFNPGEFWHDLTGLRRTNNDLSSRIPHPAVRYVHRLLSNTVLCAGEVNKIPNDELKCLWAMTPAGKGCPPWARAWVAKCIRAAKSETGSISVGGMVTLIANYLRSGPPLDREGKPQVPVSGDPNVTRLTIPYMFSASMLAHGPTANTYIWRWGPNYNAISFMVLPNPARVTIPPNATVQSLNIPPDRPFRNAYASLRGQPAVVEEEEPQEQQQEEEQPHHEPQEIHEQEPLSIMPPQFDYHHRGPPPYGDIGAQMNYLCAQMWGMRADNDERWAQQQEWNRGMDARMEGVQGSLSYINDFYARGGEYGQGYDPEGPWRAYEAARRARHDDTGGSGGT